MIIRIATFLISFLTVYTADFHMELGSQKCFKEIVPHRELLVITYQLKSNNPKETNPPPCTITLSKTPDGLTKIKSTRVKDFNQGKIVQLLEGGDTDKGDDKSGHTYVCLACASYKEKKEGHNNSVRWYLSLDILHDEYGMSDFIESDPEKVDQIDAATRKVRQALALVNAIYDENDFERKVEEEFRDQSETVNQRVAHFSIGQILLILGCSICQVYHLSGFIKETVFAQYLPTSNTI